MPEPTPNPPPGLDTSGWCLFCPHVAERHSQSDDEVWCMMCRWVCYKPADIDDDSWIGDWHAATRT